MVLYILIVIAALVVNYFLANAFYEAACDKGYSERKYFWWAFLTGMPGYLLVVALPNKTAVPTVQVVPAAPAAQYSPAPAANTVSPSYSAPAAPKPVYTPAASSTWRCSHCGTENSTNYGSCKKCGKYRNS